MPFSHSLLMFKLSSKESSCNVGYASLIPGREDPLEKGMVIHSNILAWEIPWPGGIPFIGLQKCHTRLSD